MISADRSVRTTCPYCGVGCQIDLSIKDEYIYRVDAPFDVAPNYGMLCVKGRFGTDYVKHPGRVKTPLIRANRDEGRSAQPVWREATWDEALDTIAEKYADKGVGSVFLYTHEAHPGEIYPHLTSMEQKHDHARALRDVLGVKRPIVLDALNGACHRAYGSMPNMSWIFARSGVPVERCPSRTRRRQSVPNRCRPPPALYYL